MNIFYIVVILSFTVSIVNGTKCCLEGYRLKFHNSSLICIANLNYTSFEKKFASVLNFSHNCITCIDVLETTSKLMLVEVNCTTKEWSTMTKCCPMDCIYDPVDHKCVTANTHLPILIAYPEVGLKKCTSSKYVIVDFLNLKSTAFQIGEETINCYDFDVSGNEILRSCQHYELFCKQEFETIGMPCFKKCCPDGEIYVNGVCKVNFAYGLSMNRSNRHLKDVDSLNFSIIIENPKIKNIPPPTRYFFVDKWGNLHYRRLGHWTKYTSQHAPYCIETLQTENSTSQHFFLFVNEDLDEPMYSIISAVVLIISIFFLLLTIIGLLLLPEMTDLYGKLLIMQSSMLMLLCGLHFYRYIYLSAYGIISTEDTYLQSFGCKLFGFLRYFLELKVCTWTSLICINMWLSYGPNPINGNNKWKWFCYYSIFGSVYPTFWTTLIFIAWQMHFLPNYFRPTIAEKQCYFNMGPATYDRILFIMLPQGILFIISTVYFTKTIKYYCTVKENFKNFTNIEKMSKFNAKCISDNERLICLIQYVILMWIGWCYFLIINMTSVQNTSFLNDVQHFCSNIIELSGLYIFCIYMLRKSVYVSLKTRIPRRRFDSSSSGPGNFYSHFAN